MGKNCIRFGISVGALAGLGGCESAASRACSSEYASAQQRVLKVDSKSQQSVEASLTAVEAALAACKVAQRSGETDYLVKARNELKAHADLLERRAERKARQKPSAEALAKLLAEGDPNCPKGQAYRNEGTKDIRCTGPQVAEMTRELAENYFEERGYRTKDQPPATLVVEKGAEQYSLVYANAGKGERPTCVVLVPPQGQPWQEALARATGKGPAGLRAKGTLELAQGALPYEVDETNVVIRLGACPAPGSAP